MFYISLFPMPTSTSEAGTYSSLRKHSVAAILTYDNHHFEKWPTSGESKRASARASYQSGGRACGQT